MLGLSVFGLMDCGYAGLQIFSYYKHRSRSLMADNERLVTLNMKLLGVLPSNVHNLPPLNNLPPFKGGVCETRYGFG